jgi:hypothetical protein
MKSEIFSILANAVKQASSQDKKPRKPHKCSIPDQKVVENLCQSSEYQNYVEDNLINGVAVLMNNDENFLRAEIAKLYTLCIADLRQLWKQKFGADAPENSKKKTLVGHIIPNLINNVADS